MEQVIALPQFAPLSVPMIVYLLDVTYEELLRDVLSPDTSRLLPRLVALEQLMSAKRDLLFHGMSTQRDFSVNWFRGSVTPTKKLSQTGLLSLQTVKNLRERNVFRFHGWGEPNIDSAAGIILSSWIAADETFRQITAKSLTSFVPSSQKDDEPIFWCYSQAPPSPDGRQAPILPCPWPVLPAGLPVGTLLYSGWSVFESSWFQFPGIGAMRFSAIDENVLERWDSGIKSQEVRDLLCHIHQHTPDDRAYETLRARTLQSFAQSVLQKLALRYLTAMPSVMEYPLAWDYEVILPRTSSVQ